MAWSPVAECANLQRLSTPDLRPIGYHAIHIVVKNGHVMLFGAVLSQSDVRIAGIMANGAPGACSVTNNLVAEKSSSEPTR